MRASTVYMARQPIYDCDKNVAGYELLYRSGQVNAAGQIGTQQSAQAIINSLVDIGLSRLVGDSPAFINIGEDLLLSDTITALPPGRVVLEILETVPPTPECVQAVAALKRAGHTIALDDFVSNKDTEPFVPYASIIKLDVMALGPKLVDQVRKVRRPGMTLLAEKVETAQEVNLCKRLGVNLFQGYHFSKPEIIEGASIAPNKAAALQVVSKLQDPEANMDEIEQLIVSDIALSYRLLKLVKSAHLGVPGRVASIRNALMFLGLRVVSSVASLLAMSASSDKPAELLVTGFTRAKMCELLAPQEKRNERDRYFTVGLFSVLDALLDAPMDTILAQLPLSNEVNEALLKTDAGNPLASALQTVLAFERGAWEDLQNWPDPEKSLDEVYYQAIDWASDTARALNGDEAAVAA